MTQQNKNGALQSLTAGQRTDQERKNNHNQGVNMIAQNTVKSMTKKEVFLTTLINRDKEGLNPLQAAKIYGDTCLSSIVSDIRKDDGITLERETVTLDNHFKTTCTRYWLSNDDMPKAKKMVNQLRIKRGEQPLFTDV